MYKAMFICTYKYCVLASYLGVISDHFLVVW